MQNCRVKESVKRQLMNFFLLKDHVTPIKGTHTGTKRCRGTPTGGTPMQPQKQSCGVCIIKILMLATFQTFRNIKLKMKCLFLLLINSHKKSIWTSCESHDSCMVRSH